MPDYVYEVLFEADNDDHAKEIVWEEDLGASQAFESVKQEQLTRAADGEKVQ